ncbi:hypothetical protein FRX31_021204 [Thalictrum thalictroides]|uniref:Uncharacterized protein n=1 Tax=Thalictrum thalictroides TaxID=46969 RepID=A0A7J6VYF7_THATH|nr:hypothetical protein FRX31_021204 [Thalictrum thalictroides]
MSQDGSQPIEDGLQPVEDDFQPSGEERCMPVPRGERKQIQFNDDGQPIGSGSAQFATLIGKATTTHCSPTYSDWPSVPDDPVKMKIWDVVLESYDLEPRRRACVLQKANIAWRNWKYTLRKAYDKYQTNADRLKNIPKKIKKRRLARERESPDGKVTRTQLFVALHSRKDGTYPSLEMRPTLDEIKRLVSLDPYLGERDLDNDPVAIVCGLDGRGRIRGKGNGISKTVVHASAPFKNIAQQEKRARENSEINFRIVMQRLDEETKARKVLEEKLASVLRDSSENDNGCRVRRSSPTLDTSNDTSTRCLLKNFKKRNVALGNICRDTTPIEDSYSIIVDEVFDYTTELYIGEGTFGDISIGDMIIWPKPFVAFV